MAPAEQGQGRAERDDLDAGEERQPRVAEQDVRHPEDDGDSP